MHSLQGENPPKNGHIFTHNHNKNEYLLVHEVNFIAEKKGRKTAIL
jgi:hypothetical protein